MHANSKTAKLFQILADPFTPEDGPESTNSMDHMDNGNDSTRAEFDGNDASLTPSSSEQLGSGATQPAPLSVEAETQTFESQHTGNSSNKNEANGIAEGNIRQTS